ncbi:MAG: PilN domain-containing protein [Thermoleophilaceae bacterium]
MRAVNLLPAGHRPRNDGESSGNATILLGALGLLLAVTLGYVLVSNQASERTSRAAELNQEAQLSEARAGSLEPYARFAELKRTREGSVTELASTRFDWERSMRELARLLPAHVYLTSLDASTSAGQDPATSTSASASQGPAAPSLKLTGCAPSQPAVAASLVRLRAIAGASDVKLSDSTKGDDSGASSSSSSSSSAGSSSASSADGTNCPDYTFTATVDFAPRSGGQGETGKVPTSLGGGQ